MCGKHSVSDIISSHIQTSLPSNKLQMCCDHVPGEFTRRLVAQPGDNLYCRLSVNSAIWQSLPPPQSRQEQFPPNAKGGFFGIQNRTKEAWPSGEQEGVGWVFKSLFHQKERNLGINFQAKVCSFDTGEELQDSSGQRRRSSCDSNPPEFEFWRLTNSSFHQTDSDLLSADELFHDGVLLPLHLLSIKYESQSDPNSSECDPDPSPSPVTLITEQNTKLEPGLGSELTRETTVSKRWRDIFRKSENKPAGKKDNFALGVQQFLMIQVKW